MDVPNCFVSLLDVIVATATAVVAQDELWPREDRRQRQ